MAIPQTFIIPGISIMRWREGNESVIVTCPGCDAEQEFPFGNVSGGLTEFTFVHARDDCPTLRRIRKAQKIEETLYARRAQAPNN